MSARRQSLGAPALGAAIDAAFYGRLIFGAAAVIAGVVNLMWRDALLWQRLLAVHAPFGTIAGWCVAIAQIGGITMMSARTARLAAVVLGGAYIVLMLAWMVSHSEAGVAAAYRRLR